MNNRTIGRDNKSIVGHFNRFVELEIEIEKTNKKEMTEEVRKIVDMVNINFIKQKEPIGLGHVISK